MNRILDRMSIARQIVGFAVKAGSSDIHLEEGSPIAIRINSDIKILENVLQPEDMTKLLHEKQFIIKNPEIFEFLVKRIERSYQSIYNIVKTLDKFSLQKKRQLTIPLIKEIL